MIKIVIGFLIISLTCRAELLGPIVGGVTDSSAVFILKADAKDYSAIQISAYNNFDSSFLTASVLPEAGNFGYVKFYVKELRAYTKYYYRAVINNIPDKRTFSFRTFPEDGRIPFSFGFGSCMQSPYANNNKEIFQTIGKDSLSFFIQIGDWTYPDLLLNRSYNSSWEMLAETYDIRYDNDYGFVKHVLSEMPIAYVYDDHDYAGNNSDGSDINKYNSINAYQRFFPHYSLENSENGIWHSFIYGDVEFFMLDLRSQRDRNSEAFNEGDFDPPDGHSILSGYKINGVDQKTWFINSLKNSTAKWKIIVSSVIWNPVLSLALRFPFRIAALEEQLGSLTDKWVGFPEDQKLILNTIDENNIKNVIIISGDSHSSYIDDGGKSEIPEIGASNLDVDNSKMVSRIAKYGYDLFNRGSYEGDGRAYGRLTFTYGKVDYAILELVDEKGKIWASYRKKAE